MHVLEQKHIDFLRHLTDNDKVTQPAPEEIEEKDLNQMVREGLLIEYGGLQKRYTITQNGARVARSYGGNGELEKIAVKWVMSQGATAEEAQNALKQYGAEQLLRFKKEQEGGGSGQKEVNMKVGESGRVEFKAFKSL